MEGIVKNPGLQHIIKTSLMFLDKNGIASFRMVNQDFKNIVDDPIFFVKKLSQLKDIPRDLIENWKKIIKNLQHDSDEIKKEIFKELFQMFCSTDARHPLELAYKFSETESYPDLVTTILENSDLKSYVIAPLPLYYKYGGTIGRLRPIHLAAYFGLVQAAGTMLLNFASVNLQDKNGITPMLLAARNGHLEMIQKLLNFSANPNLSDNINGETPIHKASSNGHVEIVRLLIPATDIPNAPNNCGLTPIHHAARNGHVDIVQLLMHSTKTPITHANNGWTPIHEAAYNGHLEVVQLLMSTTDTPNAPDNNGWTPIHEAAMNGHLEVVRLLIPATDTPNAPNNWGWTPIHKAVVKGHLEVVRILMETTDNPNAPDIQGKTPMIIADSLGYQEIVKLLNSHKTSTT